MSSITVNTDGITNRLNTVEVIKPPITATAMSKVRVSGAEVASAGVGKGFNACALWGEKSRAHGGLRVGAGHRIAVAAQLG